VSTSGTAGKIGSVTIGGSLVGSLGNSGLIQGLEGLGSVKIGGSLRGGGLRTNGAIGAVTIGGDLLGDGGLTISAFGQLTAPTRGLDLALKSLTVKGSVERARIELGTSTNDADDDAAVGAISVGRAWLASNLIVGVDEGLDTFFGTSDDTKAVGSNSNRDVLTRFSSIASILIKGQALGSTASGDSFGIVAEQIIKAKIGARIFKFDKGERDLADAFALAPTGPGPAPDNGVSDFFLREITKP
jgi:hypothetical protein